MRTITGDSIVYVGVSRCLLGDAVRYDGQSKANNIVLNKLGKIFELVAVCPEVEAGLSIPRPAVQLTSSIENPKLIGRDDTTIDITRTMRSYCTTKTPQLGHLSGFVFKSRSPSCGLNSTPVFINGVCVSETSRGIFASSLCTHYPTLPVIEDNQLDKPSAIDNFIAAVTTFGNL